MKIFVAYYIFFFQLELHISYTWHTHIIGFGWFWFVFQKHLFKQELVLVVTITSFSAFMIWI